MTEAGVSPIRDIQFEDAALQNCEEFNLSPDYVMDIVRNPTRTRSDGDRTVQAIREEGGAIIDVWFIRDFDEDVPEGVARPMYSTVVAVGKRQ